MRWETHPPYGTQVRRVRFAWLPVRVTGAQTVWLERYLEVREYKPGIWDSAGWEVVERIGIAKT